MLVHTAAPWLSVHMVLFRGNGCHKCATTLILWGQPQFFRNFLNSAGFRDVHEIFLYHSLSVSISCITSLLSCHHLTLRTQIRAVDERNAENLRSGYRYHCHWTHDEHTVCIQLTHFSCGDCENTCTSSYYHHQIGSMTHFRLLRL